MSTLRNRRWLLRGAAAAIALLGVIDPAITTERFARTEVAIVTTDTVRDSALTLDVRRALEKAFTVVPGAWPDAGATVIVGDRLPPQVTSLGGVLAAVEPAPANPGASLEALRLPSSVPLNGRAAVQLLVRTWQARGRSLQLTLRDGDLTIDQFTLPVTTDSAGLPATLTFVPTAVGSRRLNVTAAISAAPAGEASSASTMVEVTDARWPVLFFDPRPSWNATFLRRAIERDGRFMVTSRVTTSRSVGTTAGTPPATLAELAALQLFDVVVVSSPQLLNDRDVGGLESYLRRRGGRVVLLLDDPTDGPYRRLLGTTDWRSDSGSRIVALSRGDSTLGMLRASQLTWPVRLPAGATIVASGLATKAGDPAWPVVWRSPVGSGALFVSGALDAWRFRDQAVSGFDTFWRGLLAEAAASTPPAIDLRLSRSAIAPGDSVLVTVAIREVMLQGDTPTSQATLRATLQDSAGGSIAVRLWPVGAPGFFRGVIRPEMPGSYRLEVLSGGERAEAPLVVARGIVPTGGEAGDLLSAWVRARDGVVMIATEIPDLVAQLHRVIGAVPHRERWHPMRSPWWIVPFAGLLATEWWLRRRRGLA